MFDMTFWIIALYILALPFIGIFARVQASEQSLKDYYLAGGFVSIVPLFFTLYATQYSGNTLLGFAGKAYRDGTIILFTPLGFMMIVGVYWLYAKRLHQIAKEKGFITITDYFNDRYHSKTLSFLTSFLLMIALCSYILTNFKAVGLLMENITEGSISLTWGICITAIAMAIYESLGGMRSVIWTDIIQGSLLLMGCILLLMTLLLYFDGPSNLITMLQKNPNDKWETMGGMQWIKGISIVILISISISIYPHAIQRIYAAKNWKTLRTAFIFMLIMPLLTTLPIVLTAMSAHIMLPDISPEQTEQVIPLVLDHIIVTYPAIQYILALFMAAVIAAIMSTIDSASLSLGSSITKDICLPLWPQKSQKDLTKIGKRLSWILVLLMAFLATKLPQNIWSLLVLKLEMMMQVAPALILGIRCKNLHAKSIIIGMIAGLIVTFWIKFGSPNSINIPIIHTIHAGVWGFIVNLTVIFVIQRIMKQSHP